MDLRLLATDAGGHLAQGVCLNLGRKLTAVRHKRCSDGEYVPQILENVRDTHTVLICPTSPPTDHNLMDALILGDAIVRAAPARFTMVFPYWGYNRQDRKDKPRVPLTSKLASDMVSLLCPDNVLLFDVHSEATLGYFARSVKIDHLYSSAVSVERLRALVQPPFVVAGADKSAGPRSAYYARLLGQDRYVLFDKVRDREGQVVSAHSKVIGDVAGCDVILVDDLVDTGGTVNLAASTAMEAGARNVFLFATHGVFSGNAIAALEAGKLCKVIVTDSIHHDAAKLTQKIEVLSIANFLAEAIRRIHEGESLSELIP